MAALPATCPHGMLLTCRLAKAEWFALLCFPSVSEKKALFICLGAWRSAAHQSYPSTSVPDATAFFRHVNHVSRGSSDPCSVLMLVLIRQSDAQKGGFSVSFMFFGFFFACVKIACDPQTWHTVRISLGFSCLFVVVISYLLGLWWGLGGAQGFY